MRESEHPIFGTAEKKILIILCYYATLYVVSLVAVTLSASNDEPVLKFEERYFLCEQGGHNPSKPCHQAEFENAAYPWITTISLILLALLPFVNLTYIVSTKEVKQLFCLIKCHSKKT